MIKVLMYPTLEAFRTEESGIKRVVEAYHKHLSKFDIQFVNSMDESFDITVSHAGIKLQSDVVHTHGLYWTADYYHSRWELKANAEVIAAVRHAKEVTVPSRWVQKSFERDMRFSPHIIPHGIDYKEWGHDRQHEGYVLWNKNRSFDVCDPHFVGVLASAFPRVPFISTFPPDRQGLTPSNIKVTGLLKHSAMKKLVQSASVYLSTTKETFGIGVLEAMASGVPTLGFAHGGNVDLIEHGVTGYLAKPNSKEDLIAGLDYCLKYSKELGDNAREAAKKWTWEHACQLVAEVYRKATKEEAPTVGIVIPTYNYGRQEQLGRAIRSAISQTYTAVTDIVVVDDGSDDDTEQLVKEYIEQDKRVKYIYQENSGVAVARNRGISELETKYVVCLDADDAIAPTFAARCVPDLENDRSIGITYTGLYYIRANREEGLSPWPGQFDYDAQLQRKNQIPTCCMFRRKMWERLGGYKKRYAPEGAGSEDAEFWTRAGAYGWDSRKVTDEGLFIYSWQSGRVSGNKDYQEVDWLELHPWVIDKKHPFASMATPENRQSHLVRQYDEPVISVIIPVGPAHVSLVTDALDTLEAQTYRKWEAIIVNDTGAEGGDWDFLMRAYPYVNFIMTEGGRGAGVARNVGVEAAKAPLLLFLDADDKLYPEALESMYGAFKNNESIIYTDYVGKAIISPEEVNKLRDANRLKTYNEKTKVAVLRHESHDYDCDLAQSQPYTSGTYIWCLVSSLVPKKWHNEIGGFDEQMKSWEDWDYWLRMAYAGKCFTRIPRELVVYSFYSGTRREIGREENRNLLQYLREKFQGIEKMPCCGGKTAQRSVRKAPSISIRTERNEEMNLDNDSEMILCLFDDGNRGQHKVIGYATRKFYGQRASGETFYVHKRDIAARPNDFHPIQETKVIDTAPQPAPPPPPPVKVVEEPVEPAAKAEEIPVLSQLDEEDMAAPEGINIPVTTEEYDSENAPQTPSEGFGEPGFDLQKLPGVSAEMAASLNAMGAYTPDDVLQLGIRGLMGIKGIGKSRAKAIINYIHTEL